MPPDGGSDTPRTRSLLDGSSAPYDVPRKAFLVGCELDSRGLSEVNADDVGQSQEVEEHVGHLLPQSIIEWLLTDGRRLPVRR